MRKKSISSKKNKTDWMPINITALEEMRQPGYHQTNRGLTPNATPLEKSKYQICKNILAYQQDNNISDQNLKKMLEIKEKKRLECLLFAHIGSFSLDELVDYASKLFAPFHLEIAPEKPMLFSQKNSNGRIKKHL